MQEVCGHLEEKIGKTIIMPVYHGLEILLDDYHGEEKGGRKGDAAHCLADEQYDPVNELGKAGSPDNLVSG